MAVKVLHLYRCSSWICGEAKGHGLFVDFYADYPQVENPTTTIWLCMTKSNGNGVVMSAIRRRARLDFEKAIRKAVDQFVLDNGFTPPKKD